MPKITTAAELKEAIRLLEIEQKVEGALLKEQFKITYESLRPANLIGTTIKELTTLPDLKGNLLTTALSLGAGYLSKKAAVGNTPNPLKQLLGTFLQMGVTSLVSKNSDTIKSIGNELLSRLLSPKKTE
jgi:hypothetical protein